MTTGLFIGRFQPFHNGHLNALERISKENEKILIGIGSSNSQQTLVNPFTFHERKEMITRALDNFSKPFEIVPIEDMHNLVRWRKRVSVLSFDKVYSNNEFVIRALYRKHNVRRIRIVVNCNGSEIRRRMVEGDDAWRELVPRAVEKYLDTIGAQKRVVKLFNEE